MHAWKMEHIKIMINFIYCFSQYAQHNKIDPKSQQNSG